jgi:hypothetical protein
VVDQLPAQSGLAHAGVTDEPDDTAHARDGRIDALDEHGALNLAPDEYRAQQRIRGSEWRRGDRRVLATGKPGAVLRTPSHVGRLSHVAPSDTNIGSAATADGMLDDLQRLLPDRDV